MGTFLTFLLKDNGEAVNDQMFHFHLNTVNIPHIKAEILPISRTIKASEVVLSFNLFLVIDLLHAAEMI